MRPIYSLIFLMIITSLFSCTKNDLIQNEIIEDVTINESVKRGADFQLDLKPYLHKKQKAIITIQASDFIKSEIVKGANCSNYTYHFVAPLQPKVATNINEKVVIKLYNENSDRGCIKKERLITIHFTLQ